MKLTFEEKKLLYTYGCADLELHRKRLYGVAGLTVDPDQNKLVLDCCRKLEDDTLADWYDQMFYFVRSEMEHYSMMQKMARYIEEDEDWGPPIFDESEEGELIDDVYAGNHDLCQRGRNKQRIYAESRLAKAAGFPCIAAPGCVPEESKGRNWRGDVSGQGCCTGYPACAGILKAITDLLW